jgi:hypothetical protein
MTSASAISAIAPGEPLKRVLRSIRLLALGSLLIFSFVPVPVFINLSQVLLLLVCFGVLLCPATYLRGNATLPLFLTFCIASSQLIGITQFNGTEKNYLTPLLFIASLFIAPSIMALARECPSGTLNSLVSKTLNIILAFFVLECISRLVLSPHIIAAAGIDETQTFYLFKTSILYFDSNFVGIALVCLIAIVITHADTYRNKRLALAYLLLFATFSRASIAAGICQLAIYRLWRWRRWLAVAVIVVQTAIIVALFIDFISDGSQRTQAIDPSFSTKFYILSLVAQNYVDAGQIQKLFGIGAGNADNLIGLFAHNIVATFSIEIGVVGSVFVFLYVWLFYRKCPKALYLLVVPVVLNGFSLVSTSMPYFFASLGLLKALQVSSGPDCHGVTFWRTLRGEK